MTTGVTSTSGTPTGIVAITDNAGMTGGVGSGPKNNGQIAVQLNSGSGSASYSGLPGGTYQVSARYGGDTTFAASTSTPISVSISAEPSTTTLTVNGYDPGTGNTLIGPSFPYGSYVFADATITGTAEGSKTEGVATGTVKFVNGGTTVGTATVSSGNLASWPSLNNSYTPPSAGTYSLSAEYSGDPSYSSSAATANFTVTKAPTTIVAGYAGTPVEYGTAEEINVAVVTNSVGGAPTGTFQLYADGQPVLGTFSVYESGPYGGRNNWAWANASTRYPFPSVGQHTLSASYTGDNNYAGGTSPTVAVDVTRAVPFLSGYGFVNPYGQPVVVGQTATATIFGAQFGAAPTGTVTFYDGNVAFTDPVSYTPSGNSLQVTMQHIFTSAGTHQISVVYSGDGNYTTATSPIPQALNVVGPISLSAGILNRLRPGQSGSVTITVTPNGGFTGAVNLTCAVAASITGIHDMPTCSIPSSVSISGTVEASATLTVSTTGATSASLRGAPLLGLGGGAVLAALFLFGMPIGRRGWRLLLCLLAAAVLAGAVACGGGAGGSSAGGGSGGDPGTTPANYTVTVTGTDAAGKITAQTFVGFTVN